MPWRAAWDVLGDDLPPDVSPEVVMFVSEPMVRRGRKGSTAEERAKKLNPGGNSEDSGGSGVVDQTEEKTVEADLIDVNETGRAPSANLNLDGTHYWILEVPTQTPKEPNQLGTRPGGRPKGEDRDNMAAQLASLTSSVARMMKVLSGL